MSHVYFDITSVAGLGDWEAKKDLIVARAQQLFRTLPFFESEFQVIANNVTPYMPSGIEDERHPQI